MVLFWGAARGKLDPAFSWKNSLLWLFSLVISYCATRVKVAFLSHCFIASPLPRKQNLRVACGVCVPTVDCVGESRVHAGGEEGIFPRNCWTSWESSSSAEMPVDREEERLSLYCWSWPASPSAICSSPSFQVVATGELAFGDGALRATFCLVDCVQLMLPGFCGCCSG